MKKVLLIGGGGYVGNVISTHLLSAGYHVTILDNFIYGNHNSIISSLNHPNYKVINGDFAKKSTLEKAGTDYAFVVLLGGLVGDPITKSYPQESDKINMKGVQSCIDFFDNAPLEKFIFISTCSNYGLIKENEVADENFQLTPLSLYAKAKVAGEEYLLSKKDKVNYSGVILRFATAFGLSPRMRFDLSISEFTRDLFFEKELVVFDEHTWRPYCHIKDFARLIQNVFETKKENVHFEIFNAGGESNNYTKKMIIDAIVSKLPAANVKYSENGSDPRNYKVDFTKVKNVLGFEPQFSVKDGITELINALELGLFTDSLSNKDQYGNYTLHYNEPA